MKKYLKFMFLAVIALALASCEKDGLDVNDEDDSSGVNGKLLLVEEKVNGITTVTYGYDDLNQMTLIHDPNPEGPITVTMIYDDNGRMITSTRKSKHGASREDYTYGSGNKPVSAIWTGQADESGTAMVQYTYTKNTCVEAVVPEEGNAFSNIYTFDDKGNLVSEELFIGLDWMQTKGIYGDFDDKHAVQSHQPWHWKWSKINNNRSYFLSVKDITMSHAIEYTYNDAGYPVKAEVYDKQSGGLVESRTYIYKKAK